MPHFPQLDRLTHEAATFNRRMDRYRDRKRSGFRLFHAPRYRMPNGTELDPDRIMLDDGWEDVLRGLESRDTGKK